MSIENIIKANADIVDISISDDLIKKLEIYSGELKEWNEKINLTAITDDEGIAIKHFIDSLMLLKYVDIPENSKIIDVGTGAGFPGLVIAAARPDVKVTLLDSTGKKLKVVADIAEKMGLTNYKILNMRAEEAGQKKEYREQYDFATARAVAELRVLSEYCLPFVKQNGYFVSMKGALADKEIENAFNALKTLSGKIEGKYNFDLCSAGERNIIKIKKISQIPTKYPRVSAQIAKKPL
ncbi:MAG: 16S rRNA (guanine(527)-N(7))-methyltransferase RsmG [Ruminococcaceae bacterium]|nr:16S rRNA (guanine(527)-N(7))-methyltransferase RsmG [Oscillospiraceae bacterium]